SAATRTPRSPAASSRSTPSGAPSTTAASTSAPAPSTSRRRPGRSRPTRCGSGTATSSSPSSRARAEIGDGLGSGPDRRRRGGGAGGRAVGAVRQGGLEGRIVLVGAEPVRPYERPPLSKELLQGKRPPGEVFLRPADWYEQQAVELRLGRRAVRLEAATRTVV